MLVFRYISPTLAFSTPEVEYTVAAVVVVAMAVPVYQTAPAAPAAPGAPVAPVKAIATEKRLLMVTLPLSTLIGMMMSPGTL